MSHKKQSMHTMQNDRASNSAAIPLESGRMIPPPDDEPAVLPIGPFIDLLVENDDEPIDFEEQPDECWPVKILVGCSTWGIPREMKLDKAGSSLYFSLLRYTGKLYDSESLEKFLVQHPAEFYQLAYDALLSMYGNLSWDPPDDILKLLRKEWKSKEERKELARKYPNLFNLFLCSSLPEKIRRKFNEAMIKAKQEAQKKWKEPAYVLLDSLLDDRLPSSDTLSSLGCREAVQCICARTHDAVWITRAAAISTLALLYTARKLTMDGETTAKSIILAKTEDENWAVRATAVSALSALSSIYTARRLTITEEKEVKQAIFAKTEDENEEVRAAAVFALAALFTAKVLTWAEECEVQRVIFAKTMDENWRVRAAALSTLASLYKAMTDGKQRRAKALIGKRLKDENKHVRFAARVARLAYMPPALGEIASLLGQAKGYTESALWDEQQLATHTLRTLLYSKWLNENQRTEAISLLCILATKISPYTRLLARMTLYESLLILIDLEDEQAT